MSGSQVTIKRVSDERTFEIPVASLVPTDRAWLKSYVAKRGPGAKWLPLTVEIPLPAANAHDQKPRILGVRDSLPVIRTGAATFDLLLPIGAWLHIDIKSYGGASRSPDHLVKFNGERHWKVRIKDDLLLLSRDGGAEEVAGLTLPSDANDFPEILSQTTRYKPGLSVCLEVPYGRDYVVNPSFGSSQIAMVIRATTSRTQFDLEKMFPENLKALYINLSKDKLDKLKSISELEALDLRLYTSRNDPDLPPSLSYLPKVRDLYLSGFPNDLTLHNTLLKQQGLRCLSVYHDEKGIVVFQGIDQLKSLEFLDLGGCQFEAAEYCSLPVVRAVSIDPGMFTPDDTGLSNLKNLKGVQILSGSSSFTEAIKGWAQSGALSELERLRWGAYFDPENTPKLNYVDFGTISTRSNEQVPLSEYSYLPNLEYFELSGAGNAAWQVLSTFKNRENLKSLEISFSPGNQGGNDTFGNHLSGFKSLRNLKVSDGTFEEIDLTSLDKLEAIEIRDNEGLTKIGGIDSHESLRGLYVQNCKLLKSISGTQDNQTLQYIQLNTCPQVTDVSAANTAKALKIVRINECDSLQEPQPFLESDQLLDIQVSKCKKLRDRRISR